MEQKKRVIALGFFDGVHNGHAALMRRTAQVAKETGATPSAFTFDPHPQTVILGRPMPLLTSPEDRAGLVRVSRGRGGTRLTPAGRALCRRQAVEGGAEMV